MVGPVGGGVSPSDKPVGGPSGQSKPFSLYGSFTDEQVNQLAGISMELSWMGSVPGEKLNVADVNGFKTTIQSLLNQKPPFSPEVTNKLKQVINLLNDSLKNENDRSIWTKDLTSASTIIGSLIPNA